MALLFGWLARIHSVGPIVYLGVCHWHSRIAIEYTQPTMPTRTIAVRAYEMPAEHNLALAPGTELDVVRWAKSPLAPWDRTPVCLTEHGNPIQRCHYFKYNEVSKFLGKLMVGITLILNNRGSEEKLL